MNALIKKELLLAAHPMTYITIFFGAMLLIPSYPYFVAFFYVTLGIFFAFMNSRENRDIYFSLMLPVSKRDIVRSKFAFVVLDELISIIISIPFAILTARINPNGSNLAGMEANVAFYGCVFVMLAVFNAVFLTDFFKTAYKVGIAFLKATSAVTVCIIAFESLVFIPQTKEFFDATSAEAQLKQLPVLIAGIAIYIAANAVAVKSSVRSFQSVDL